MDLALVTGWGVEDLTNIYQLKPYFLEENIFCIGHKELDEAFVKPIKKSNITYYDLPSLRKYGIEKIVEQFIKLVELKKLEGFLIHLDVDILSSHLMPAVDCPDEFGLDYQELLLFLNPLISHPLAVGMEITILDPYLDQNGLVTTEFIKQISTLFKP